MARRSRYTTRTGVSSLETWSWRTMLIHQIHRSSSWAQSGADSASILSLHQCPARAAGIRDEAAGQATRQTAYTSFTLALQDTLRGEAAAKDDTMPCAHCIHQSEHLLRLSWRRWRRSWRGLLRRGRLFADASHAHCTRQQLLQRLSQLSARRYRQLRTP